MAPNAPFPAGVAAAPMNEEDITSRIAAAGRVDAALVNLQPLRDLARNWDIDIGSALEEYLHDLTTLGGTPPNPDLPPGIDASSTDWAKSALLLQNSSCVYGRKVEYLHSLVYNALNELIATTRKGANGSGKKKRSGGGADADVEEFREFDPDVEFLLLDDVLPTDDDGGKINLREDGAADDGRIDLLEGEEVESALAGRSGTASKNSTHLSLGGLSVTRLDKSKLSSFALGGPGRGGRSSDSHAAKALMGSLLSDGAGGGAGGGNGGSLRLLGGRCDVSESGALLMPGSALLGGGGAASDGRKSGGSLLPGVAPDGSFARAEGARDSIAAEGGGGDDDNDFGGGGAFDDHDDGPGFEMAESEDKSANVRRVAFASPVAAAPAPASSKASKTDPWSLLDPHDPSTAKPRPLKVGVTYRLPPGLDTVPAASVTGARTKNISGKRKAEVEARKRRNEAFLNRRSSVVVDTFEAILREARRDKGKAERVGDEDTKGSTNVGNADDNNVGDVGGGKKIYLPRPSEIFPLKSASSLASAKGLAFGEEFAYVARAEKKRRAVEKRKSRKKMEEGPEYEANAGQGEEISAPAPIDRYDDDEDDYGGGFDFGGDDDNDAPEGGGEEGDGLIRTNVGMTSLDEAFGGVKVDGTDGLDSPNHEAKAFEALCRLHVQNFARGAERYAAETRLTKRVGDWQNRLAPLLAEEEDRPEFNVRVYGDRILQAVQGEVARGCGPLTEKVGEKRKKSVEALVEQQAQSNLVDFVSVTKNCETFEVCRLFLSSLMLSNSGNIVPVLFCDGSEIAADGEARVASPKLLKVRLLRSEMDLPMDSYLAPSVKEQQEMTA